MEKTRIMEHIRRMLHRKHAEKRLIDPAAMFQPQLRSPHAGGPHAGSCARCAPALQQI